MPTLTSAEILMDVMEAFKKRLPALNRMGTDFRAQSLKLNNSYTAHIATIPTVDDVSTTYATTGNNARDLLTDVPIVVNRHKAVRLKWQHLNAIKDQKNRYEQVVGNAGYAMAKAVTDDIIAGFTPDYFSQSSTFAVADSDADMLDNITGDLNLVGAMPDGRTMLVNTPVANVLSADSRLTSADYAGQRVRGSGYRRFTDVNGFAEIIEYPDLSAGNGTQLTAVTAEADDDIFTKATHGLATGQALKFDSGTGFTGISAGTTYYVIRLTENTFKLATSRANAEAGTAIDITVDGSAGAFTATQSLTGFAFDPRAIALLTGIPDDFNQDFLGGLNIPRVMGFESVTDPETGLTMAAVSWQDAGTGDLNWAPTLVWGKALGKQAATAAPGAACDYAGHRLVSA